MGALAKLICLYFLKIKETTKLFTLVEKGIWIKTVNRKNWTHIYKQN